MSNLVHTYIEGNSFNNIYGGRTDALYGTITHLTELPHSTLAKWPWMQDTWHLCNGHVTVSEWYKTLQEAKKAALKHWPDATFKTRKAIAKELAKENA
jgi:hypothetical protein